MVTNSVFLIGRWTCDEIALMQNEQGLLGVECGELPHGREECKSSRLFIVLLDDTTQRPAVHLCAVDLIRNSSGFTAWYHGTGCAL